MLAVLVALTDPDAVVPTVPTSTFEGADAEITEAPVAKIAADRSGGNGSEVAEPEADHADDGVAIPYSTGLAATSVGQLQSADTSCTATMIPSRSGRIAVTAAHCVYADARFPPLSGVTRPDGWIEDLIFYSRGSSTATQGWPVARMWVDTAFLDNPTPALDVAFLEIADQDGVTAQRALGAQGIAFHAEQPARDSDKPRPVPTTDRAASPAADYTGREASGERDNGGSVSITVLGYPVEPPFDGTRLHRCSTPATTAFGPEHGHLAALRCSMTGGSSGGPWLAEFDPATGSGLVVAVTSFATHETPGVIGAAPLGKAAARLLDAADDHALGSSTKPEPDRAPTTTPTPPPTTTSSPTITPVPTSRTPSSSSRAPSPNTGATSRAPTLNPAHPVPRRPAPTASPTFTGIPFPTAPPGTYRDQSTTNAAGGLG